MMFKKWRGRRLIVRLTGLMARLKGLKVIRDELTKVLDINEKVPSDYVDHYLDLCQQIAELEFKIECLRGDL